MEKLPLTDDLVFETPNDGIIVYGDRSKKRLIQQAEELRIRRLLCHEDEPFIIYTTGGQHDKERSNGS